jgi:hypothetical protein
MGVTFYHFLFLARMPRRVFPSADGKIKSNHFFAGSAGEKILLSLQTCPTAKPAGALQQAAIPNFQRLRL